MEKHSKQMRNGKSTANAAQQTTTFDGPRIDKASPSADWPEKLTTLPCRDLDFSLINADRRADG